MVIKDGLDLADISKSRNQVALIQAVRLIFLIIILVITLGFQASQPEFTNFELLLPVYSMLAASFFVNALYLFYFDRALKWSWPTACLFAFDAVFVTVIIYSTGISQSIFLFFYLINIILCGLIFLRKGALALALWTTILYCLLVVAGEEVKSNAFYLAFTLNLAAFFAVAVLSGYLSEQLNFAGRELKARSRDLEDLTDLNQLIVENIATGLMTIDSNSRIVTANQAAREILDRQSVLLGVDINELFSGFTSKIQRLMLVAEDARKIAHFDVTYRNLRDAELILEMAVSSLHRHETDETGGYIVIFQDLTKVRRLEFAMRQSEKMAAVGQLAAGIAHEIRNPLASISGSIQLLRSMASGQEEADQAKLMSIVLKEIDRLNNLISEFLDFVRPDAQDHVPVQINSVLSEITDMVRVNTSLRSDVAQTIELKAMQPIAGQFDKLKQAFLNIVINAYQAMEKTPEARITITSQDVGSSVVVRIRDTGPGISEVNLKRIFEPFHTTKAKGTGLGLAVTHKILENHGVKIFVNSTVGVGTEFTLEFPRLEATQKLSS